MVIAIALFFSISLACSPSGELEQEQSGSGTEETSRNIAFSSSDKNLERVFHWARRMALSYAHDGTDPVGYWIEAALPGRDAFAVRDMLHQALGAEPLGLSKHNWNMTYRFAENISESKDWCTYWEIDKTGGACPADYKSDANFWYNLPANFDMAFSSWRLYEWTGDKRYIEDPTMLYFFDRSFDEYIKKWQLEPDRIMNRTQYLNNHPETRDWFKSARGLPSYDELKGSHEDDYGAKSIGVGSDLVAYAYAGFTAYSNILRHNGETKKAEEATKKAREYYDLLHDEWWNTDINMYMLGKYYRDEDGLNGTGFISDDGKRPVTARSAVLWVDAVHEPDRAKRCLEAISWMNAEGCSYLPLMRYRCQWSEKAYDDLYSFLTMYRNEYPEVSYAAIEALVSGLMGIVPSASKNTLTTMPQLPTNKDYAEMEDVAVLGGHVTVRHEGNTYTEFTNNTKNELIWKAAFTGVHNRINVNGKYETTSQETDRIGNKISYVEVKVKAGDKVCAKL